MPETPNRDRGDPAPLPPTALRRVGVYGLGTIGRKVVETLHRGIEGLEICGVTTRSRAPATQYLASLATADERTAPPPLLPLEELARQAEILVDCAPAAAFRSIAAAAVAKGRMLVTVSAAALLENEDLAQRARSTGARIIVVTGALLGLDAVRAAAEGDIHSVKMVTRKPPRSLVGAPGVLSQGIDLDKLEHPLRVFHGTSREGARLFPANVNVAAALGLAGVGPDRTELEIWADPSLERNTHTICVEADSARFQMTIENIPTVEHPGTGRITALSVIAYLRSLVSPLKIGT